MENAEEAGTSPGGDAIATVDDGGAATSQGNVPVTAGAAKTETTFLVIVHARLHADDVPAADLPALAARVAEAFIARDDAATVWISFGGKPSRITLDVPAADRGRAIDGAKAIVARETAGLSVACEVVATAATTEREREVLPVDCPAGAADPVI